MGLARTLSSLFKLEPSGRSSKTYFTSFTECGSPMDSRVFFAHIISIHVQQKRTGTEYLELKVKTEIQNFDYILEV